MKTEDEIKNLATAKSQEYSGDSNKQADYQNGFLDGYKQAFEDNDAWISVEDGLPFKDGNSDIYCLVIIINCGVCIRPYSEYHECWNTEDNDDYYCDAVGGKITHWKLLPKGPKKE